MPHVLGPRNEVQARSDESSHTQGSLGNCCCHWGQLHVFSVQALRNRVSSGHSATTIHCSSLSSAECGDVDATANIGLIRPAVRFPRKWKGWNLQVGYPDEERTKKKKRKLILVSWDTTSKSEPLDRKSGFWTKKNNKKKKAAQIISPGRVRRRDEELVCPIRAAVSENRCVKSIP